MCRGIRGRLANNTIRGPFYPMLQGLIGTDDGIGRERKPTDKKRKRARSI
jgi:hypothetical protein